MLSKREAIGWVRDLQKIHQAECDGDEGLDEIHRYWRGKQQLPVIPDGVPNEVRRMARMSRVNITKLVIDVLGQSMYGTGFKDDSGEVDEFAYDLWQANKMDAHQLAIHRAAFAYGASYVTVLPGDPHAVVKGHSPRSMTAVYAADDEDWPMYALQRSRSGRSTLFRLYDGEHVYHLAQEQYADEVLYLDDMAHGAGVTPVVRFRATEDLDDDALGEIVPVIPLQDQMDLTTFELLVAQHFSAFRQRYILGWVAESETQRMKASASRLLTFEHPEGGELRVGEFGQTDLRGYLENREGMGTLMAAVSQTPPQSLLGKMMNLSAEALAAAESGHRRKAKALSLPLGENHEQWVRLAAMYEGREVSDTAQLVWADTEARSFAATIDGLGKAATMLKVPPQELWERIPGTTQKDVETWKKALDAGGGVDALMRELIGGGGASSAEFG